MLNFVSYLFKVKMKVLDKTGAFIGKVSNLNTQNSIR